MIMGIAGLLVCMILSGCRESGDAAYFRGEIREVIDSAGVDRLVGESVMAEGPYVGPMFVYDSLMFFLSSSFPDNFYSILNLRDGSHIGFFCGRGRGPQEVSSAGLIDQFIERDGELLAVVPAPNEARLMLWNVTQSIARQVTVYDTVFTQEWMNSEQRANYYVLLDDETLFVRAQPVSLMLDESNVAPPYFEARLLRTGESVHKYEPYPRPFTGSSADKLSPLRLYEGTRAMKPDRSKFVEAMVWLPQLNILDLHSWEMDSYRLKGACDFGDLAERQQRLVYSYGGIAVSDERIYALYAGTKVDEPWKCSMLHVYDWNGKLIRKLDLGRLINRISLDPANPDLLYGCRWETMEVFRYDLSQQDTL